MERLSLDQFKSISQEENQENLELLTGGILGACHVKEIDLLGGFGTIGRDIVDLVTGN